MPHSSRTPRVVVLTSSWTESNESATGARLLAGALSRHGEIEIVHLSTNAHVPEPTRDSVFSLHTVPVHGASPLRAGILRAALGVEDKGRQIPRPVTDVLLSFEGRANRVGELVDSLRPDAIVLCGHRHPYDLEFLLERGTTDRPRVAFAPLLTDFAWMNDPSFQCIVERADVIGVSHPGERRAIERAFPERTKDVAEISFAFTLNKSASSQGLFGLRFFGNYVLLIRSFPPGGARFSRSVSHELLRMILSDIAEVSVAEVDGDKWRVSDRENTLELPVNPTRVNLWRLMSHARCTVDLRPPGPLGQEAIESMLLGTPVVVPEESAAMEHVAAANGGLWYRDFGEIIDATRVLMDGYVRARLSQQARRYATEKHARIDDFVEQARSFVLG